MAQPTEVDLGKFFISLLRPPVQTKLIGQNKLNKQIIGRNYEKIKDILSNIA